MLFSGGGVVLEESGWEAAFFCFIQVKTTHLEVFLKVWMKVSHVRNETWFWFLYIKQVRHLRSVQFFMMVTRSRKIENIVFFVCRLIKLYIYLWCRIRIDSIGPLGDSYDLFKSNLRPLKLLQMSISYSVQDISILRRFKYTKKIPWRNFLLRV